MKKLLCLRKLSNKFQESNDDTVKSISVVLWKDIVFETRPYWHKGYKLCFINLSTHNTYYGARELMRNNIVKNEDWVSRFLKITFFKNVSQSLRMKKKSSRTTWAWHDLRNLVSTKKRRKMRNYKKRLPGKILVFQILYFNHY